MIILILVFVFFVGVWFGNAISNNFTKNLLNKYEVSKTKIPKDFKPILRKLIQSHSKLSFAEFIRNPKYNSSHYSSVAEQELIDYLLKNDKELLDFCLLDSENKNIRDLEVNKHKQGESL